MSYKVGDVAKLTHVSVRALHHWDELGLVVPSERSEAGYRLYSDADLQRLQQVLFYRELGFTLEEIRQIVSDPDFDASEALVGQREQLRQQIARLQAVLALVDKTIASHKEGSMKSEELFEVFGDFNPREYDAEAEARWGESDAWKESQKRTRQYGKADWARYKDESDQLNQKIASLMDEGISPDDDRAKQLAEEHRQQINQWFYECSPEMHRALGDLYVSDARFEAAYEKVHVGMAAYLRAAIHANAAR